ncbi:MAG TPA: DUF4124 domain-containing protein [Steroidobacteraceae bacterium]|nr:DUF4124 domain-containing protein [Steroidobacteraceae bacterium]
MKICVALLASLLALAAVAQETKRDVWVWTDQNGVMQYSDRPVPGARKLLLSTASPEPPPAPAASAVAPATAAKSTVEQVEYQSLEIWQPENGESFFGADATVDVRMRTEPAVADMDTLRLYLDGKLVEGATDSLEYTLSDLERGAHSITAVITDDRGNEKIRSEPRVFHIKQPTVIQPRAVGPNIQPKPTPRTR